MKKFKIIGPITTKELELQDDEMLEWNIIKIKDYQKREGLLKGGVPGPKSDNPNITTAKKRPQPNSDGILS